MIIGLVTKVMVMWGNTQLTIMIPIWKVSASDTVSEGGNEQTTRGNLTIEVYYYIFFHPFVDNFLLIIFLFFVAI